MTSKEIKQFVESQILGAHKLMNEGSLGYKSGQRNYAYLTGILKTTLKAIAIMLDIKLPANIFEAESQKEAGL